MVDMDGRILETNPAFQRMLGYSSVELSELTLDDVTHPDDLDESLDSLRELGNGRIPHYRIRKRYVRKDGSKMWADLTVSMLDNDEPYAIGIIDTSPVRWSRKARCRRQRSAFSAHSRTLPSAWVLSASTCVGSASTMH